MAFSFKILATLCAPVSPLHVSVSFQVSVQVAPPLVLNPTPGTLMLPHIRVNFCVGKHAVLIGEGFITLLASKVTLFLFSFQYLKTYICFFFDFIFFLDCGLFITAFGDCDISFFLDCRHFITAFEDCDISFFLNCGYFITALMDLDQGCMSFNSILFDDLFWFNFMTPLQMVYEKYLLIEYFATLLTFVSHQVAFSLLVAHQVTPILELHPTLLTLKLPLIRMHLSVLLVTGP